jgi:lipopolysaccharide export system protein LptC
MKLILSHRRMVGAFKIISSLGIISVISILYLTIETQKLSQATININPTLNDLGIPTTKNYEIILQNPVFEGTDQDLKPYKITAYSAIKISDNKYKLNKVNATYTTSDKNYISVIAKYGTIREHDHLIKLSDNVHLSYERLLFNSNNIEIDLLRKEAISNSSVLLTYKNSRISADRFKSQDSNRIVTFKGNVRAKIHISDFNYDLF